MYNGTVEVKLDETQGKHQYQVTDSEKGLVNATMRGVTDIKRTIIAKPALIALACLPVAGVGENRV